MKSQNIFSTYKEIKKKCFSGKENFQRYSFPEGKFYYKEPLSPLLLEAFLAKKNKFLIHSSRRTILEKMDLPSSKNGETICLKHYLGRHFSKARKSFAIGEFLRHYSISTPAVLGLIELTKYKFLPKKSILITQFASETYELHWQIRQTFRGQEKNATLEEEKKQITRSLAYFMAKFHQLGLFHSDLSPQNILVQKEKGQWKFFLIDLEDIKFISNLTLEHLQKNFIQLADLPKWITSKDCLFFFFHWVNQLPLALKKMVLDHKKQFIDQIAQGIQKRIERRILKDGKDWMSELNWIPTKGFVGEIVPKPTLPPQELSK